MSQTFSQFKDNFYQRFTDLSVFDCEDFNLLKVVLDGLKVDYVEKGIYNEEIFRSPAPAGILRLTRKIKYYKAISLAKNKIKTEAGKLMMPFLFFDGGRVARDREGKPVSFYFNRIENYLGSENCFTIYQANTILKNGPVISRLFMATLFESPTKHDRIFIGNLIRSYEKISSLNVFKESELRNIRIAINKFYNEHRFWSYFLRDSKIRFALFDQHYHREGFIHALKTKNIGVIEVQHGLIAPEDIFYVFPRAIKAIASRALFPDLIFTFGSYWSDVLKKGFEFKPDQVKVLGMYQENNTNVTQDEKLRLDAFLNASDFILVTTQTFLHDYFNDYIQWLSNDLRARAGSAKIVVKNHPAENESNYQPLKGLDNVIICNLNSEYLLSRCKWHISCYSTTLYDATKYDCLNFSLFIEVCKDYINTFIQEGISNMINKRENPIAFGKPSSNLRFDKKTLYENFDDHKHKLKELERT